MNDIDHEALATLTHSLGVISNGTVGGLSVYLVLRSDHTQAADTGTMFAGELEERFRCPVCCQLVIYPVQFEQCGHELYV